MLSGFKQKILTELKKSFHEDKTPHQIASSFSIGVFVTALPTLGLGLFFFAYLSSKYEWVSRLAIFSSAFVLNPLVKPFFYIASINLGSLLVERKFLIPNDPESLFLYMIVGSIAGAAVLSIFGYFMVLTAVKAYRKKDLEIVEDIEDAVENKIDNKISEA